MATEPGAEVHDGAPRCLLGLFDATAGGFAGWSEFDAEAERWGIEVRGLSREDLRERIESSTREIPTIIAPGTENGVRSRDVVHQAALRACANWRVAYVPSGSQKASQPSTAYHVRKVARLLAQAPSSFGFLSGLASIHREFIDNSLGIHRRLVR